MYIESIRDSKKCVGCGNCKNVCPRNAIIMREDEEGFLVPHITDQCVNCGICEKKCPFWGLQYTSVELLPEVVVTKPMDNEIATNSASGGLCYQLSLYFLKHLHGYVCGSVYGKEFYVEHTLTNDVETLKEMRGSKYVQSDLSSCFVEIEKKLKENSNILFIGTGCQVYALKKYLGKDYNNLYCIDLICHGVPSPKVQREYVNWISTSYGEVSQLNNRDKVFYSHSYVPLYSFTLRNGKKIKKRYSDDPMADAFFQHLSIRSSCFDCKFKTLHRISDLTIGDFWFSEQIGCGEDLYGNNLCVIQSDKGRNLINEIADSCDIHAIDSKMGILLNGGMLYSSVVANVNRKIFFEKLGKEDFAKLVYKYDGISKKTRIKYYLRELLAPFLRKTSYYKNQKFKSVGKRKQREIPDDHTGLMHY